jgi:hypothetical protein
MRDEIDVERLQEFSIGFFYAVCGSSGFSAASGQKAAQDSASVWKDCADGRKQGDPAGNIV